MLIDRSWIGSSRCEREDIRGTARHSTKGEFRKHVAEREPSDGVDLFRHRMLRFLPPLKLKPYAPACHVV